MSPDELAQVAEVHSVRGYQSQFGTTLHFGLGERERVDRMEIRWPGGKDDALAVVTADQRLHNIAVQALRRFRTPTAA